MSTHISVLRPDSPSVSSLAKSQSVRSQHTQNAPPSALRQIVTAPPWARDEPPSPIDQDHPISSAAPANSINPRPSQSALSDSASTTNQTIQNPYGQKDEPSWWMFTRRGRAQGPPHLRTSEKRNNWSPLHSKNESTSEKRERPMRERARTTWLAGTQRIRQSMHTGPEGDQHPIAPTTTNDEEAEGRRRSWGFPVPLPTTPAQITLSQNRTPGWDTPWSARAPHSWDGSDMYGSNLNSRQGSFDNDVNGSDEPQNGKKRTKWYHRRKRLRAFILHNTYVPLLFRVINITLTTAALAVAIRIRMKEKKYDIMGAVGSSPTLVIIFAPLTLVHVMIAIYLEYFGRPLGLWRTSGKLIHTLSETVFICAWSAALSLCFDNFFTSVIGCAPESDTSWYNEIPRIVPNNPNLGRNEGQPGDYICDNQVALICLVFLGLIMYCTNLFISLFRIFEKVKFHSNFQILPR